MALEILLAGVLLAWIGLGLLTVWGATGTRILRPGQLAELPIPVPKVSILVAARNEEEALPAALQSLLALDYPDYEVILVDDDSTDRSGVIADGWARHPASAGRLKVIHNHELPAGWRGKVYALSLAANAARGEWLLSTDADVVFHPPLLRLAVSCARKEQARLVSLLPEFEFGSTAEKIVLPAFSFLLATLFPLRLINSPKSPRALAAGAFLLMRREDYEALGGYAWLRDVVAEDLRMAQRFKRSGRRIYVALTRGLFRTRMYKGWHEMWEGLARSAFEGTDFSLRRVTFGVIFGNLLAVFPWVAAAILLVRDMMAGAPLTADSALVLALGACLASAAVYLPILIFFRVFPLYVLTLPVACLFYSGAAIASTWMSLRGRGISWKGRHYRPPASSDTSRESRPEPPRRND
jgi:chlorobactene glucosyltransferase